MKKKMIYLAPKVFVAEIVNTTILADSGVSSDGYMKYGGVDDTGSKDPASIDLDFEEELTD